MSRESLFVFMALSPQLTTVSLEFLSCSVLNESRMPQRAPLIPAKKLSPATGAGGAGSDGSNNGVSIGNPLKQG